MAEFRLPPPIPLTDVDGREIGRIEWVSVSVSSAGRSLDIRGVVYGEIEIRSFEGTVSLGPRLSLVMDQPLKPCGACDGSCHVGCH